MMADNRRLIDANEVLKRNEEAFKKARAKPAEHFVGVIQYHTVKEMVTSSPTIDAVEVVHGRWEDMYGGKYANPRYRCSVCKEKALYKFERDLLGNHKDVQALTPICPYCMAKLDGGKANDI